MIIAIPVFKEKICLFDNLHFLTCISGGLNGYINFSYLHVCRCGVWHRWRLGTQLGYCGPSNNLHVIDSRMSKDVVLTTLLFKKDVILLNTPLPPFLRVIDHQ